MENNETPRELKNKVQDITKKTSNATKETGKATTKTVKNTKRLISATASVLGISGIELLAIILVLIVIINIIVASLQFLSGGGYVSQVRLTDEGTQIVNTFKVYTNDLYEYYSSSSSASTMMGGTGERTLISDSYRLGVAWNSNDHDDCHTHDDDTERDKYRSIISKIEENEYEFVLCGIWKVILRECYLNVLSDFGNLEERGQDWTRLNPQGEYVGSQPPDNDPHSNDAWYRGFITHYFRYETGTYNAKFGFHVSDSDAAIMTSELVHYSNPLFVKEAFKCCLDAFIDSNGNFITSIEALNTEISGTTAPATIAASSTPQTTTAAVSSNTRLLSDVPASTYSEKITEKIMNNLIRATKSHYLSYGMDDNRSRVINNENCNIYAGIQMYYNHINGLTTDSYKTDAQKDRHTRNIYNLIKEKISTESSLFLEYISMASGNVSGLVQLAHQQKGNSGNRYCDAMGFGLTEWCAIYAGWLLKNGGGVDISEYGWDANVGVWCDALIAKGVFHLRGTYVPVPGDIIIFGAAGARNHVGIVIESGGGQITTSEGNTDGFNMSSTVVGEHIFDLDNTRIYGYGHVTYQSAITGVAGTALGAANVSVAVARDSSYKSIKYTLTAHQRRIIEETVSGEYGEDSTGAALIAQCCRDALVYGFVDKPENLPSKGGYDGYYAWGGAAPTQIAKDAVVNIFDNGGYVVQHRMLVMYNPQMVSSSWHEERMYVCTYGPVRFFDFWEGEHF